MDTSRRFLIVEIKRQIRILESDTSENRGVEQKKKYLGIIDARQQNADQRYRTDLLALLSDLTSGMHIRIPIATFHQAEIDWS